MDRGSIHFYIQHQNIRMNSGVPFRLAGQFQTDLLPPAEFHGPGKHGAE